MSGLIAGTVLLERNALQAPAVRVCDTPHGRAEVAVGHMAGVEVALIQRHGRLKDTPPHRINHAANLAALAGLGATRVLSLGSTGCLRADVELPALMIPDDYINFFDVTVFNDRLVHVTPGFDPTLRAWLIEEARLQSDIPVLDRGTYFQLRGPRLDTRAEVRFSQSFADCVGMTIGSEATIAKELGLAYASLCTLDNYANGVRDLVVSQTEIQTSASRNADLCLAILAEV
ncbi:MAG TPA: MTAP family purine nucleoside phosphorylase, partial [Polyangia bacterium]